MSEQEPYGHHCETGRTHSSEAETLLTAERDSINSVWPGNLGNWELKKINIYEGGSGSDR